MHYKQHIPSFCEGITPEEYEFENVAELLDKNKKILEYDYKNCIFATDEEGHYLMLSSTTEKYWWVLGYVDGIDLSKTLPIYDKIYNPKPTYSDSWIKYDSKGQKIQHIPEPEDEPDNETIADRIREMTDEELAEQFVMVDWDYATDSGFRAIAVLAKTSFFECDSKKFKQKAIEANLERLRCKIDD